MGDQAGRRYPPVRKDRKMVFDRSRAWWQVASLLAIAAITTYALVIWL